MNRLVRVGMGVLVFQENKILLGKRINSHGENSWQPPGGHLEFGESPEHCAKRELFEETGLIAKKIIRGPWNSVVFEKEEKHYISLFMFVLEHEGTLFLKEPEKCASWEWFHTKELPFPLFLPLNTLIIKEGSLDQLLSTCSYKGV